MKNTTNYSFKLPDSTDLVNVDDINSNFSVIDAELGAFSENFTDIYQKLDEKPEIVIDQTYNPESSNAQSGTAVAEAIAQSVGDISTALDELHNYAEALKGGTVLYTKVTLTDSETGIKYTMSVSNGKVVLKEEA